MKKKSSGINFSKETQGAVVKVLQEIIARMELEFATDRQSMEKVSLFRLHFLEGPNRTLGEIMLVLRYVQQKIPVSDFEFKPVAIIRKNPKVAWSDLLSRLGKFTKEIMPTLENTAAQKDSDIIHFTREGEFYRYLGDKKYLASFRKDHKKMRIFLFLHNTNKYTDTTSIITEVGFPSNEAARKAIGELNSKLRINLSLEKTEKAVQGKSGSGYRLNPKYRFLLA